MWLCDEGEPLGYWGGQSIFRRLRNRSGIGELHAHLLRHTFAQAALTKGADLMLKSLGQRSLGHWSRAKDPMSGTRQFLGHLPNSEVVGNEIPPQRRGLVGGVRFGLTTKGF